MSAHQSDVGAVPAGNPSAGRAAEPPEELLERSLPELVKQLADQTTTLIRQEIELAKVETREAVDLAKAEMTGKAKDAGKAGGMVAGAGVVALLAGVALTAFLILLLGTFLPDWVAALIVTVVYAAIAAVLALQGKKRLQQIEPAPRETIETVKEDIEWAKTQNRSATR